MDLTISCTTKSPANSFRNYGPTLFFLTILFASCIKENSEPTAAPDNIVITSISPSDGPAGTIDTITGSGFDQIPSFDSLFLNGKQLVVNSKTSTQIVITIPKLAGSGNLAIWVDGQIITGPVFHYDSSWFVTTFAGSGQMAFTDGQGLAASFYDPRGIVMDKQNNLFIGDPGCIRKITPDGTVTTFAGNGLSEGWADGTGTAAQFGSMLWGLALDSTGNLIVADGEFWRICKITPDAVVTTIAGGPSSGNPAGPDPRAPFSDPTGVAVNAQGNILVVDRNNNNISMIDQQDVVTTLAGSDIHAGWVDGTGTAAEFFNPYSCALDSAGNLYVGDGDFMVRKVTPGGVVTTVAGSPTPGFQNGQGANAAFVSPVVMTISPNQDLFVADGTNAIRRIDQQGNVTTFIPLGIGDIDGPVPYASARFIYGMVVDPAGNFYFTDNMNHKVRKISWQ
jgi:sugar lactone lactonase YvrE